jgi:ADP-ribosylglycohydrolase/fructose-1,6-bisphosphatase/inositol monophosphatase family enzyme
MLDMDLRAALDVAVDAARAAGAILRDDFHRPDGPRGHVDKAEADVEAERLIRSRLGAAFPDWGYLGEETGRGAGEAGKPVWLVDPNDGTRDYLVGRRGSAVSIGLVRDRLPVLGVVFAFGYPDDGGDLFAWAEGCGPMRRNGHLVGSRLPDELSSRDVVLVSSKGDRAAETNLLCAAPARYRPVPSIAHRLALVAAGEAAAATSIHSPGAWDYGAGHALLRGVGGVLVDESGDEIVYAEDGSSKVLRAFGASPTIARMMAERRWERALTAAPPPGHAPARLKRGEAVRDSALLGRAQGCLLGQVAGDSLGSLVEFQPSEKIARDYLSGPEELQDGGEWRTLAGQPTDDSEMALALARALVAYGGFDAATILSAYQEWYRSGPFDIGQTTRAALTGSPTGVSEANGSLMRASPLGVFAHGWPAEAAADLARRDSALTHPNRVPSDAAAAFVVAVSHAVGHGEGGEGAWSAALSWARGARAALGVIEALERAATEAPVCDGENQGWALIALQAAFYAALHFQSPEDGVVSTVRRGGDTDTNAAIAGALLGAVHGRASIPRQWRSMVLSCRPHRVCAPRPRPIAYWPGDVLELSELLLLAGARAAAGGPLTRASVL